MASGVKTGGRVKGSKNKATLERTQKIMESGLTPLEFLVEQMRSPANELAVRIDAAKAAAPYIHPKLANVQHTGPDGGAIKTESKLDLSSLSAEDRAALKAILSRTGE